MLSIAALVAEAMFMQFKTLVTLLPLGILLAAPAVTAAKAPPTAGPRWFTSLSEAKQTAAKQNKLLLIEFYTVGCPPCAAMASSTFQDPRVVKRLEAFVPVRLDIEENPQAAAQFNIGPLPTLLYTDVAGKVFHTDEGYQDASGLLRVSDDVLHSHSDLHEGQAPQKPRPEDAAHPLGVGMKAPTGLVLQDSQGHPFNLDSALAPHGAIILFYRGGWCAPCSLERRKIAAIVPELEALGFKTYAISPDRPGASSPATDAPITAAATGASTSSDPGITLLSDSDARASQAFGVAYRVDDAAVAQLREFYIDLEALSGSKSHLLPLPSAFIVDGAGIIRFAYSNRDYHLQVDPAVLLAAARTIARP